MIILVAQNHSVINFDNITTLNVDHITNDDGTTQSVIVANQMYIVGYYDNDMQAVEVIDWIVKSIGETDIDKNICIHIPTLSEVVNDAEND